MTSQLIPAVRIAADISDFNAPCDLNTGRIPTIWRGNDFQIQLGIFCRRKLQAIDDVASIVVALKPCGDDSGAPAVAQEPYLQKEIFAADFDSNVSEEGWKDGSQQQMTISFSAAETGIPPGECWLVIWAKMTGDPVRILTLCAGRMAVLESFGGILFPSAPPIQPTNHYYDKAESDGRFLKMASNFADLPNKTAACRNLALKSAALAEILDESDFGSNSTSGVPSQRSAKAYVDDAVELLQQNLAALEESIQNGSGGNSGNDGGNSSAGGSFLGNYWPSNAALNHWSNGVKVNLMANEMVAGADGWMGFRETANSRLCSMQLQNIIGDDRNKILRLSRQNMDNQLSEIAIYRPFLPSESYPLRGKTLTFAFDISCGENFPWNSEDSPLKLSAFGHDDVDLPLQKLEKTGEFPFGHREIKSVNLPGLTTQKQRQSLTFAVPENLQQLGIKFSHRPTKINAAVGNNYYFELSKLSLVEGEIAGNYSPLPLEMEWNRNKLCHQKVIVHYAGPVIAGSPLAFSVNFPLAFVAIPDCRNVLDNENPVGFAPASANDATQISTEHCVISRMAQSEAIYGSFDTTYWFAYYLW